MARQPRWDAPGAVHHVMARGIERRPVFVDDEDRHDFVTHLEEVLPDCGASCFAWALMSNHYHLVVQTERGELSRTMRRLNTGHAVRFNLRHERVGFLFQNRFRSRLVDSDEDLRGLIRYVHANPWTGGLVGDLDELARFPWCGYGALMGQRRRLAFERVDDVLRMFGDDVEVARRELRAWMARSDEPDAPLDRAHPVPPPACRHRPSREDDRDVASGEASLGGHLDDLVERICRDLGVSREALEGGLRRAPVARARALICHVAVTRCRVRVADVARAVGVSPSGVSRALERGAALARELHLAGSHPSEGSFSISQHRPR